MYNKNLEELQKRYELNNTMDDLTYLDSNR